MRKNLIGILLVVGICLGQTPKTLAQAATTQSAPAADKSGQMVTDQDIQLMRQDIRSKKKQLVAANLTLTDAEATKFWPIYDQYTAELVKINDAKYAAIKEYAEKWGTMSDADALALTQRALAVDESVAQLRSKYVPIFQKAVPGTKVATFFQLERRLQMLIDLQLASQLPLVQDQK